MAPGISHSRFTHPIDSERPKGASRFEFLAPKLKRRVTLFDPFHVRLWALLESNPRVLRYCERPAYWQAWALSTAWRRRATRKRTAWWSGSTVV